MCPKGFSTAELATLAGMGRDGVAGDLRALEELELLERRRVGRRDHYFPRYGPLAAALTRVITAVDRQVGPPHPPQ